MSLTANPTQRDCQTPWRPRIAEKEEAYLREMWALTSKEAWERPSAAAASHCSEAARRCDHWLRKLRSAAGLHSLSDEGDGDGEAAGWWGGRVGVAAELSIASPAVRTRGEGFCVALSPGPLGRGTGKRYLALAAAALQKKKIRRALVYSHTTIKENFHIIV
jgi:hypothetical protein